MGTRSSELLRLRNSGRHSQSDGTESRLLKPKMSECDLPTGRLEDEKLAGFDSGGQPRHLCTDGARSPSSCVHRPRPRSALHFVAIGVTAHLILVSYWWGVVWSGGPQPRQTYLLSPKVRKALDLFVVEALEGGVSGAAAMVIQVFALLWLRTTMNYQYKHGGSFVAALSHLHREGGITRLYSGLTPALMQAPLARFGDTAANDGVRAVLASIESTANWPIAYVSICSSLLAGLFRVVLMPLEVVKTSMQVEGAGALRSLRLRLRRHGACVLWEGLLATFAAHFAGHLPWFATRNLLLNWTRPAALPWMEMCRMAAIGLASSLVSDLVSNPPRVIKTVKQTSEMPLSYRQTLALVLSQAGVRGLFLRGIGTKMCCNALQSVFFSVVWHRLHQLLHRSSA